MTQEQKVEMMESICMLLTIIHEAEIERVNVRVINRIKTVCDKFLELCYILAVQEIDFDTYTKVLQNLIENENDYIRRIQMRIQMDAMISLQQPGSLRIASMIIFSHFGLDFKSKFSEILDKNDKILHYKIFVNNNFIYCDIKNALILMKSSYMN